MLLFSIKITVQMCSLLFSWKFLQVSCPVLIGAAIFCPLWSNKTSRCGDSQEKSAPSPELQALPSALKNSFWSSALQILGVNRIFVISM